MNKGKHPWKIADVKKFLILFFPYDKLFSTDEVAYAMGRAEKPVREEIRRLAETNFLELVQISSAGARFALWKIK